MVGKQQRKVGWKMVKDMRGICVSRFAPQISPLIQDGMFQLGCRCTEDMFHLLRGHDPWASWRRGVTLQTPLPPRMCGKVARNGQTSLPIVLASSRMIGGPWNCRVVAMAGWCSFSIAGARDEEFFCAHMRLVWQDEWWVSDASRKNWSEA